MKRSNCIAGVALAIALTLLLANPTAQAGRVGGPLDMVATVPIGQSVFFEIPFGADDQAIVTVIGDGRSVLHLLLYDFDGHVAANTTTSGGDRRTVSMSVYRAGTFRVEVRNMGVQADTFVLRTN
jgi:hypothetical protein